MDNKTSIGCSYKGRIWSRRKTDLTTLRKWCSAIGNKILDDTIDPDEVLKGTLVPKIISQRPEKMPIGIEWPETIFKESEKTFSFVVDDEELHLYETDIVLIDPTENGDLKFEICSEYGKGYSVNLHFRKKTMNFSVFENKNVKVKRNTKSQLLEGVLLS